MADGGKGEAAPSCLRLLGDSVGPGVSGPAEVGRWQVQTYMSAAESEEDVQS